MLLDGEAYFPMENVWLQVCPMNPRLHRQKKEVVEPRQSPLELQEEAEVQATEIKKSCPAFVKNKMPVAKMTVD